MAGIYFHIPFCKQACHYCDFHFSTSLKTKDAVLNCMHTELKDRASSFTETIDTIYFGGGTPSILDREEFGLLLDTCKEKFQLAKDVEICLEANPDDLDQEKLKDLKAVGVQRLSIGVQSFNNEQLAAMNRAHNASESHESIKSAQETGFENISIDLIYALPGLSDEQWKNEIQKALALDIQHISAYCLTVEEGTALHHFVKAGKVNPANDDTEKRQFDILMNELTKVGFEHYEISNFSMPGYYSRHNTSYWKGESYLGIGPSAHSFDGRTRRWNVSNNVRYVTGIREGGEYFEHEELTAEDRFNEAIMLGLRTKWGVDIKALKAATGIGLEPMLLDRKLKEGYLKKDGDTISLTTKGKFVADRIASELFVV